MWAASRITPKSACRAGVLSSGRTAAPAITLPACHTRPFLHRGRQPPTTRPAVKAGASVSDSLIQVLKDELKYQKEEYRTPAEVEEGPPAPFKLDSARGKKVFSLTGKFGEEDIIVELNLEDQPGVPLDEDEEDDFEDEDEEFGDVVFTVNVLKNDRILAFECESNGESVVINHLQLLADNGDEEDEDEEALPAYTGPVFEDLDDTLKQAFVDYLEERGITAELGAYLITLTTDKSWNEYMRWLTRVKNFIAE